MFIGLLFTGEDLINLVDYMTKLLQRLYQLTLSFKAFITKIVFTGQFS